MGKPKKKRVELEKIDPLIPVMNLVCMLIPFLLLSAAFVQYASINVQAPKIQSSQQQQPPPQDRMPLNLTVMVTDAGFIIKVDPQYRMPWMSQATDSANTGPDIPKKPDGKYNYEDLLEKIKEIKDKHPDESQVIIGMEDTLKFDILIKVMDATRGTDTSPLFPDVVLTRGIV